MTLERRKYLARLLRDGLFDVLGRLCKCCGTPHALTFDCIIQMGDRHHRMNAYDRIKFYWTQHTHHQNVQVLCDRCNDRKQ